MTDKQLDEKSDDLMRLFFSFCDDAELDKYIDEEDTVDKKLIDHIIRWLDHNIDEAHTIIAEDSQDLKDKIELYLEGVDEFV